MKKCPLCGEVIPDFMPVKPFSFMVRKASVAIIDGNGITIVVFGGYGGSQLSGERKLRAEYVLSALNAYEPQLRACE